MNYTATIIDFNFMPMIRVSSILHYWVHLPDVDKTVVLQAEGSVKQLGKMFQLPVEGENSLDFTGFIGRNCIVSGYGNSYTLVTFE